MLVIVVMALLARSARMNDDPLTQKACGQPLAMQSEIWSLF